MAISRKTFIIILASLTLIRIIMVIALVNGIPETQYHKGWYFHHGGDEEEFFRLALSLAKFQPVSSYRTLGFPLLLAPFIWLVRANDIEDILIPVAVFHSCILFGISIFLVAFLAEKLTKNRTAAILSAALWTFFPHLFRILISFSSPRHHEIAGIWMTHWMWLQVLSDPLSVFLIISATYITLISLEKEKLKYVILSGILFSWSALTRSENAILLLLASLIYLFQKDIKKCLLFICTFLITFSPQLIYNYHYNGSPFRFALLDCWREESPPKIGYTHIFSVENIFILLKNLWIRAPGPILLFILCILILIGRASIYIYKQRKLNAMILISWIFLYVLVYGCFSNMEDHLWQYLMSFLPAVIILLSSLAARITNKE